MRMAIECLLAKPKTITSRAAAKNGQREILAIKQKNPEA
jgi:hypothetical protein